ncbi:MAG: PLP-dependent aminotransferase family protein [Proteobacteria bacterium]|nr:PLP-dependent aminotransferase family protein [Pseudomonadota bacterium]
MVHSEGPVLPKPIGPVAPPLVRVALDGGAGVPLRRQIAGQLRAAILERRLPPGARLPSSRRMAAELNCARGTVLAAIDDLIAEGYVVARPGSGVAAAANLPDEMLAPPRAGAAAGAAGAPPPALPARTTALLAAARDVASGPAAPVAFPLGQPDREAFPFPLWAKLLEREWRRPGWQVAGAPHPFGHAGLRAAIAAYLGAARGFACEAAEVVVTSGVQQAVTLFARAVLEPGARAWIEEPGYPGVAAALEAAEAVPAPVPIDAAGFSAEAALAAAPDARLAVVAPSHHFPLGTVMSLPRRLALLAWAERAGGWIVEDDFDGEYRYAGRPLAPLRALDRSGRVAYLGSFSKLLFPTLRLSFMVLPPPLAAPMERVMAALSAPAALLGQGALARFIADGHFAAHLRRTRVLYAARQEAVVAAAARHLRGMLAVPPDVGGMHLVARPDAGVRLDDRAATAAAGAACVRVARLSVCYRGEAAAHGLLLGYAGTPDADIEPAIRRLADALAVRHAAPARPRD